jgi:hypothetical protein
MSFCACFFKGRYFVKKQIPCFERVIYRIVQFIGVQLFVFHQAVVGPRGKKQGREVERVNGFGCVKHKACGGEVHQVVLKDVVSAQKACFFTKIREANRRVSMEHRTIGSHGADVGDAF